MAYAQNLKERILDVAKELAQKNGISNVNVRQVASETGIALGTIYNYYPSKGDLIAAIVEDFWKNAFIGLDVNYLKELKAIDALEKAYFSLLNYFNSFKTDWLSELISLKAEDKKVSREREREYLGNVLMVIEKFLRADKNFSKGKTEVEINRISLFVYDNLLAMLKRSDKNFEFFKDILIKMYT